MLTTMLPPSDGRATVAGFDLRTQAEQVRRHVGHVPHLLSVAGELTGDENMLLCARLDLVPRAEREGRIRHALELMGLTEVRNRLLRQHCGGMIPQFEIAWSTRHAPSVIFLDHPTEGLDPVGRRAV